MPATQAKGGFGTKLYRDNGAGTFAELSEIMDVSGPEVSQETVDATHMASPNGFTEKIAVGLRDAGDVTFAMNLIQDDASHGLLEGDLLASTLSNYRLVYPSGTKRISFSAFVKSIGPSFPMRDKMVRNVVLTVTGKPVRETHP